MLSRFFSYLGLLATSLLLVMLLPAESLRAQQADPQVIDEDLYWILLGETDDLLIEALAALPDIDSQRQDINVMWENIRGVQLFRTLPDGTIDDVIIQVDTSWLLIPPDIDRETLEMQETRIRALLDYRAQFGGLPTEDERLLELLQRLREGFQYNAEPETPNDDQSVSVSPIGVSLARLIFMIGAALTVAFVLFYFIRNLRVQTAEVAIAGEGDDLPATSQAADTLADQSQAAEDYRAAIRYLYLSSLLSLDERGIIHFDPTLTNTEHLRQLRGKPELLNLLTDIINVFDHVWYGFAPVSLGMYQQFRQNVDSLKRFQ